MAEASADSILSSHVDGGAEEDLGPDTWSNLRPRKLDEDMVTYVKGVEGALASALDAESHRALVKNVFEELINHEASLSCAKRMSYALEALLRHAEASQLETFLANTKRYFGFVSSDRQGSHVLQTLFSQIYAVLNGKVSKKIGGDDKNDNDEPNEDEDDDDEDDDEDEETKAVSEEARKKLRELVLDLAKTLVVKEVWIDMMYDPCATHVVRALLLVLAGQDPREKKKSGETIQATRMRRHAQTDSEFTASLTAFMVAMASWTGRDIKEACENTHASPVVQIVLQHANSRHKSWKAVVNKVVGGEDGVEPSHQVFWACAQHRVCSHVVQVVVTSCDDIYFDEMVFEKCIKGSMLEGLKHPVANHVLQSALGRMHSDGQVKEALDELEPEMEKRILGSRLGILWRLCEASVMRSKNIQSRLTRTVLRALRSRRDSMPGQAGAPKGAIEYLLGLEERNGPASATAEKQADDEDKEEGDQEEEEFTRVRVSVLGARVAGAMLQFAPESARTLLESLASMDELSLQQLACDPVGGRYVLEPLMDAPEGALWAKQRVLAKLKSKITRLAGDKFGCHVLRKAFDAGTLKDRTVIVKALSRKQQRLAGSKSGANLLRHCKVTLYARHPDQWNSAQNHVKTKTKKQTLTNFMMDLEQTSNKRKPKSSEAKETKPDDLGEPVRAAKKAKKQLL